MKLTLDYIPNSELAIISNDGTNAHVWRIFRGFLGDYIPSREIVFSEYSVSFSWQYFIAYKGNIRDFIIAHRGEGISFYATEIAKRMISSADNVSYEKSVTLPQIDAETIQGLLFSAGFKRILTENQLRNLSKISQLPAAATFSVPGAGKTTEALAYFFLNAKEEDKLLVVAPINAFGAWDEQITACIKEEEVNFARLQGGEEAIYEKIKLHSRFFIISYDQLVRATDAIATLLRKGNFFMFLDESHRIKGGKKVKRGEAVLSLDSLPKRKLVMSGTPMPQSTADLIPQFSFLYPSKHISEDDVVDIFGKVFVRTTQGELGIPEIHFVLKEVEMNPLQRNIYDSLKSETKRQMIPMINDNSVYALRQIGKCIMKVMEFVSNPALLANDMDFVFNRDVAEALLDSDGPKIDYVCKRTRQLVGEGKKVVIWSCFVQNILLLSTRLSDLGAVFINGQVAAGDEDDETSREGKIKLFKSNKSNVLIANPAACSEGISLHDVCQYAIYLDRSFNAAHYLQSRDRIHRLGMPAGTFPTIEIVECKNSIDEIIRQRLDKKVNAMADALNDSSLRIRPSGYEYNDEEDEFDAGFDADDAKAIMSYFFPENTNA